MVKKDEIYKEGNMEEIPANGIVESRINYYKGIPDRITGHTYVGASLMNSLTNDLMKRDCPY